MKWEKRRIKKAPTDFARHAVHVVGKLVNAALRPLFLHCDELVRLGLEKGAERKKEKEKWGMRTHVFWLASPRRDRFTYTKFSSWLRMGWTATRRRKLETQRRTQRDG